MSKVTLERLETNIGWSAILTLLVLAILITFINFQCRQLDRIEQALATPTAEAQR